MKKILTIIILIALTIGGMGGIGFALTAGDTPIQGTSFDRHVVIWADLETTTETSSVVFRHIYDQGACQVVNTGSVEKTVYIQSRLKDNAELGFINSSSLWTITPGDTDTFKADFGGAPDPEMMEEARIKGVTGFHSGSSLDFLCIFK